MKFAFIIMGPFDPQQDRAAMHGGTSQVVGVSTLEQACSVAKELAGGGIGCIELCGAFGEDGARKVIEATQNKIPVGYVVHLPEQDELFRLAFSKL